MYTVLDVVELGRAQDLIFGLLKSWLVFDDMWYHTMWLDQDPWD